MELKVTEQLVKSLNRAAVAWKAEPDTNFKHSHFDLKCEEEFGIDVGFRNQSGKIVVEEAVVIDEDKYINFLLRFG